MTDYFDDHEVACDLLYLWQINFGYAFGGPLDLPVSDVVCVENAGKARGPWHPASV